MPSLPLNSAKTRFRLVGLCLGSHLAFERWRWRRRHYFSRRQRQRASGSGCLAWCVRILLLHLGWIQREDATPQVDCTHLDRCRGLIIINLFAALHLHDLKKRFLFILRRRCQGLSSCWLGLRLGRAQRRCRVSPDDLLDVSSLVYK